MREDRLFINYRRDDSRADSGRLYDRLAACFPGKVFRDVASIAPGVEWDDAIARVLSQSDACLVVIGKNWLNIADAAGNRRLADPRDTVRQEIAAVLKRNMRVFPVLVGGATMPAEEDLPAELQPLCRRNAIELTEAYWDEGVQKLIVALEPLLGRPVNARIAKPPLFRRGWVLVTSGALAAVIALAAYFGSRHPDDPVSQNQPAVSAPQDYPKPNTPPQTYAAFNPSQLVGNWRGVVTAPGQQFDEVLEAYPDSSFRVLFQNMTAGVGTWQYDSAADSLKVTNYVNLNDGVKFSCDWKNASETHDRFNGACIDRMQHSWSVSMAHVPGRPAVQSYIVPRVNVSGLTTAERATFSQYLASQRCTCKCGLTLLMCLRKDLTCPYSPNLAQNALAAFLRLTRA